jgi:ABC-type antimicrobial peptide transport system permease subunit
VPCLGLIHSVQQSSILSDESEVTTMNLWQEFTNDPVIFISFTGLAIVIGLCLFYATYFMYKIGHDQVKE